MDQNSLVLRCEALAPMCAAPLALGPPLRQGGPHAYRCVQARQATKDGEWMNELWSRFHLKVWPAAGENRL